MAGAFLFTIIIMVLLDFAAGAEPTLYEVLKVPKTATSEQITKAYKKLIFKYHPDKNLGANAEHAAEMAAKINYARGILVDADQRNWYDIDPDTPPPKDLSELKRIVKKFKASRKFEAKIAARVVAGIQAGILAGIAGTIYGVTKLIHRRFFDPCGKCTRGEIKKHGKPAKACKLQIDTCRNYFDNVHNQCKDQCTREKVNAPMHGFLYKLYKKDAKVKFTQIENATTNADLEGPRQFAQEVKTLEDNGVGNRFGSQLSTKINKAIQRKQDSLN